MSKTNAVRILESHKIEFSCSEYEFSEDEIDAVSVANKLGLDPESVFKTLVTHDETNSNFVFIIPGSYELDLKKAASACGRKRIEMIKLKDLQPLTGYIRGGCSPVGMKKLFPSFIDESAQLFDVIYVSAGMRGMQMRLNPKDLADLIGAEFVDLI